MAERPYLLESGSVQEDARIGLAALFATGDDGIQVVPGVLSGLAVAQTSTASGSVTVGPGRVLNQASSAVGGAFVESNDATKTVDVLGVNPAESSPRNDLIVYESGPALGGRIRVVKGTANAAPVDPAVPAQATALARVRVKSATAYAGNEVIVNADVDDLRSFTSLTGKAPKVTAFSAAGSFTWNKTAGCKYLHVQAVGAGGGGGVAAGAASGQGQGGGGGGGGYCESILAASDLPASVTVTVGAGGSGQVTDGDPGGASTFGAFLTAGGGQGGAWMTATAGDGAADGGAGGTATGGNRHNIPGGDGWPGRVIAGKSTVAAHGGPSYLSGSRRSPLSSAADASPGLAYGGGGAGAFSSTTSRAGGTGAPGRVVVVEYF